MENYREELEEASVIFLHAPGINKLFFLAEGKPLKKMAAKVKPIQYHLRKANFTQITAVLDKLIEVRIVFKEKEETEQ